MNFLTAVTFCCGSYLWAPELISFSSSDLKPKLVTFLWPQSSDLKLRSKTPSNKKI
jgi:hypothetical protein